MSGLMEAADGGRTVLAPSAELAAALFDAVERGHRKGGREIWPTPQVRDFGSWLKERHARRQFEDSRVPRCLSDVEERELWRRVVLDSGHGFLEPAGAARAARRARRAMAEYGIAIRAIAQVASEESQAFIDWNARFSQRCRELNCISADELLGAEEASVSLSGAGDRPAWIESPLWRPAARRWLNRHAGAPLEAQSADPASRKTPSVFRALSADTELAAAADWARDELRQDPDFRAWICVPDLSARRTEVQDAFDAQLAPQRFSLDEPPEGAPFAIAGGTPLAEYPPVRAALDLLAACSGAIFFDQFSALIRSHELQAAGEAGVAARLDAALRRAAPSEAPLVQWLELAQRLARTKHLDPVAALTRLTEASRALEELSGHHPMSRWLSVWVGAFDRGPWDLRHRWSSSEFQSAERFRELMGALAIGDRLFEPQTRASAEGILRRAAREAPFQAQTGVPPIWISGQPNDPWLTYHGLWVSGCDEGRWPPPPDPIPLLPVAVQRQHGVVAASADAQLAAAEDLQRRWVVRASHCVFSCADLGSGGDTASPLLPAAARDAEPPLARPAEPQPHWLAQWRQAPVLEAQVDERAPPFGPDERTKGVSTLKSQSLCAFRGFAETRLDAQPLERPSPGFNERERGELLHHALQGIWLALGDSEQLAVRYTQPAAFSALIAMNIESAIEKLRLRRDPGAQWRERERIRLETLLRRWLDLERERPAFKIERLEEAAETAQHAGLDFSVRIDRIDLLEDGSRVLIDYKSGYAGSDWRGDRPANPQLPIYALLHPISLVAVAYGRVNAALCEFVAESERAGIFPRKKATKLEGAPSFDALLKIWSTRIERLAQAFAHGDAAVDPTETACRWCRLQALCRVPSTLGSSVRE